MGTRKGPRRRVSPDAPTGELPPEEQVIIPVPRPPRRETAAEPSAPAWDWKRDGLLCALAALAAFIVYANSLGNGFVYDDLAFIQDNKFLAGPWQWSTLWTGTWSIHGDLYRPFTVSSFALDRWLFGPGPAGVHRMNVIVYSAACALVFALVRLMLGRRDAALLAALIFAVHPVHTEVVANGVGRAEIHSFFFIVLAAIFHLFHLARNGDGPAGLAVPRLLRAGPAWTPLALAMVCYLTALLFKESAATVPGLLFLMELFLFRRARVMEMLPRVPRYLAYALPLAIYLIGRSKYVNIVTPAPQEVMMAPTTRFELFLYANETMARYIGQIFAPIHLCAEYSDFNRIIHDRFDSPLTWVLAIGMLVFWAVLVPVSAFVAKRGWTVPLFGVWWYLLAFLPTSNLIIIIGTVRGDRLQFLPSLGYAIGIGWVLAEIAKRKQAVGYGIAAVLVAAYSVRTIQRNPVWKTQEALFADTVRQVPGSAVAWNGLGGVYRDRGEDAKAEEAFRKAAELRASRGFFYASATNSVAALLRARGEATIRRLRSELGDETALAENPEARKAVQQINEAIALYGKTLEKDPKNHVALTNSAEILLQRPETRKLAIERLTIASGVNKTDHSAPFNLAQAWRLDGNAEKALEWMNVAAERAPGIRVIWEQKAALLAELGRTGEADAARQKAASLPAK